MYLYNDYYYQANIHYDHERKEAAYPAVGC
jgi:hypothetical protein